MRVLRHLAIGLALLAGCAGSDRVEANASASATGTPTAGAGGGEPGSGGAGTGGDGDGAATSSGDGGAQAPAAQGAGGEAAGQGGDGAGGGDGGSPPVDDCGDGLVTGVEECDDGNDAAADGCTGCVVDCDALGDKHPVTHHCFRVFPDETSWPFAEANCAAWGGAPGLGHLASIDDEGEQAFLYSMITAQTWIGVQDPVTEGVYQWSDGTPWEYEFWAPGEPDNTFEEDCAFMRLTDDGGWNDHACGDLRPAYACERRAAGTF